MKAITKTKSIETKNIVYVGRSIDGYIAGKKGELDWLDIIPGSDKIDMGYVGMMAEIDALVMGRVTFEVVLNFGIEWPYKKPVFVLSNSVTEIPDPLKEKVFLTNGSPQKVIDQLHTLGYHKLYIDGGVTVQQFLEADLIDEMTLTTIPIVLGGGTFLFGELSQSLAFEHVESKVFLEQIVQDKYRRKRTV